MQRLTTDHYRTAMTRLRRFENILDEVLRIDRVNNLCLHDVRRDMGLLENALRACEDGFCRLRYRREPAGLLGFDARLLLGFLLRVWRSRRIRAVLGAEVARRAGGTRDSLHAHRRCCPRR